MEATRDWVLIYAGVLWGLVTLVIAVVIVAVWYYSGKGLSIGDRLLMKEARPRLARVHAQLAALRDRSSHLPGNIPLPEADARPSRAGAGISLPLPWRRKKRHFLFLR